MPRHCFRVDKEDALRLEKELVDCIDLCTMRELSRYFKINRVSTAEDDKRKFYHRLVSYVPTVGPPLPGGYRCPNTTTLRLRSAFVNARLREALFQKEREAVQSEIQKLGEVREARGWAGWLFEGHVPICLQSTGNVHLA